jgi:hypothetical protein
MDELIYNEKSTYSALNIAIECKMYEKKMNTIQVKLFIYIYPSIM